MKHILLLLTALFFIAGCTSVPEVAEEKPLVGVTFYPYYEITKHIAKDSLEVYSVVPVSSEPHEFEPSQRDIARLQNIQAYISTGVEFEEFENTITKALPSSVPIILASNGIELLSSDHDHHDHEHSSEEVHRELSLEDLPEVIISYLENLNVSNIIEEIEGLVHDEKIELYEIKLTNGEELYFDEDGNFITNEDLHAEEEHTEEKHTEEEHTEEEHTEEEAKYGIDPHVWLSIKNVKDIAVNINEGLKAEFPLLANQLDENTNEFLAELSVLEEEYATALNSCNQDTILVSHNAYQYLARDYGFEVISVSGLSHESEPSPQELSELIEKANEHNIKVVFFEELVSPRVAETIASEVGAEVLPLHPLEGTITGESLIDLMKSNLANLKIGLECS